MLPCRENQILVWQLKQLNDFEPKLKCRNLGDPSANSGIEFRSQIAADRNAKGTCIRPLGLITRCVLREMDEQKPTRFKKQGY